MLAEESKQDDLIKAFASYEDFCKSLLDAFVLIDNGGYIVRSNLLFQNLVNKKSKQITKIGKLSDIIQFRLGNKTLSVIDILNHESPTRWDEVQAKTDDRRVLNLILGIYPFKNNNEKLGAFLLMRDVTDEAVLQDKYKTKSTESITDPLTGLYNRLYFERYLPSILEQMVGEGEDYSISVLMIDVDHFKHINDTHGHLIGDFVLESISRTLKEICRKSDIVCRYGGEEFLIILPGTDLNDSKIVAEKLRKAVEEHKFEFETTQIDVTISIGSTEIKVGMEKAEDAIARADRALYHSKESGRNKVSLNLNGKIID